MSESDKWRRQQQGAIARSAGILFECAIEAACACYSEQGYAHIQKTPEPIKQISRMEASGHFRACYTKQAQPDFTGTLYGGRSVVFEAKHTGSGRIALDRITATQWEELEKHWNLDAIAFVLVQFGGGNIFHIPWRIWRSWENTSGKKSISERDLIDICHYKPIPRNPQRMIDFMHDIKEWGNEN